MAESFKDLIVWQRAMRLVKDIYRATDSFPKEELYVLTAQLRRAAISIPSNIAEGKGRFSRPDFLHFLMQARGSLYELQTQVMIAADLHYLSESAVRNLQDECDEVARMLNGLVRTFRDKNLQIGKA